MENVKKLPGLIIFLFLLTYSARAQDQKSAFTKPEWNAPGYASIDDFIRKNLKYPEEARKLNFEGTVMVMAVVDTNGVISELSVVHDPGNGLGEEALRLIKSMPPLKPATHNGEKVRLHWQFPVKFELTKIMDIDSVRKIDKLFDQIPDVEAQYPGGRDAMQKFINDHFKVPSGQDCKGVIRVSASIDENGRITEAHVVSQNLQACDNEAVRVVKSMPDWIPGKRLDQPLKSIKIIELKVN